MSREGYRPLRIRAIVVRWLLLAAVVLQLVAVGSTWAELRLVERMEVGDLVTQAELDDSDRRQSAVAYAQLAVVAVTGGFFIAWLYRAYTNLPWLGAEGLRFHRGWAIGAWFVPILNLVRPKQIVNDVWRASDPELPPRTGLGWIGSRVPAIYAMWWGLFLASWGLSYAANTGAFGWGETLDEVKTIDRVWIIADLGGMLAALVAVRVVRLTTQRQEWRAEHLSRQ